MHNDKRACILQNTLSFRTARYTTALVNKPTNSLGCAVRGNPPFSVGRRRRVSHAKATERHTSCSKVRPAGRKPANVTLGAKHQRVTRHDHEQEKHPRDFASSCRPGSTCQWTFGIICWGVHILLLSFICLSHYINEHLSRIPTIFNQQIDISARLVRLTSGSLLFVPHGESGCNRKKKKKKKFTSVPAA